MDNRQKKFYKQMNKGIKQYERKSHREYDPYGKMNKIKDAIEYAEEPKKRNGCRGFACGCLVFIGIMIFIASIVLVLILFI